MPNKNIAVMRVMEERGSEGDKPSLYYIEHVRTKRRKKTLCGLAGKDRAFRTYDFSSIMYKSQPCNVCMQTVNNGKYGWYDFFNA